MTSSSALQRSHAVHRRSGERRRSREEREEENREIWYDSQRNQQQQDERPAQQQQPPRFNAITVFIASMLSLPVLWLLLNLAKASPFSLSIFSTRQQQAGECEASTFTSILPPNAVVENITAVSAGSSFGEGPSNLYSPKDPINLPELCAVVINVTSSPTSSYRFGLFLPPPEKWNPSRRFMALGNGGFGGGIYWLAMAPGAHLGIATLSTDTGHNSTTTDLSWALRNPEKRTDWGWRALHGSVELGKKIVEHYYGGEQGIKYSYYAGCSTGGRQGLKEIQTAPDSFDGVLIGAPAWWTSHLSPYALRSGLYNLPIEDNERHIPAKLFSSLAKEVVRQCDNLDGVEDGIVSDPDRCTPDLTHIQCGREGVNESACLTEPQLQTVRNIYTDWRAGDSPDGELLHPALNPSSEAQWDLLFNSSEPSPFGVGYVRNFVLDDPDWDWKTFDEGIVRRAIKEDPGDPTADQYDITPFRKRGGKVVLYHGEADGLVPVKGSTLYHERSLAAMGKNGTNATDDMRDFFRLLLVPGMQHCGLSAVSAPWNFGAPVQHGVMGLDVWSVPGFENSTEHDIVLALIDWVEKGKAVERVVATTWNEQTNASSGVRRQRPICAWPERAVWDGKGDVDVAGSWRCEEAKLERMGGS